MKNPCLWFIIAGILVITCMPYVTAAETIGGDQGWYVIHCNVYGADVYFDDKFVGTTVQDGTLTVASFTTGTPYQRYLVKKYGYVPYADSLPQIPGKGESVDLYATLHLLPLTTPPAVGGDRGWYIVRCNVDGATVKFDDKDKGEISQGMLYVEVSATGTPFRGFTVQKSGYSTYSGTISRVPLKGEMIDLYATINPLPTATPTTPGSVGGSVGWYVVHSNVDGATVSFDNDQKGEIVKGLLSVQVYTTGTPYKTFMVTKTGYVPFIGAISQYPAKGETIDLYATLNPQPAETTPPTPLPTTKSPLALEIIPLALLIGGMGALMRIKKVS